MNARLIPATATLPAIRLYDCGCTYSADGWSHCFGHTTSHGILVVRSAAAVSRAQARRAAWLATKAKSARVETRECHGGTLTLYHYDRPSWESKEDRP